MRFSQHTVSLQNWEGRTFCQRYSRVEVGFQQLQFMSKTRRKHESEKLARCCHRNPFVHFPDSRGLNALAETGLFSRWHGWYPALKIMHRQTQSPPPPAPPSLHPAPSLLWWDDALKKKKSLINPLLLFDDFHHNRAGLFSSSPSRVFIFCRVCF